MHLCDFTLLNFRGPFSFAAKQVIKPRLNLLPIQIQKEKSDWKARDLRAAETTTLAGASSVLDSGGTTVQP